MARPWKAFAPAAWWSAAFFCLFQAMAGVVINEIHYDPDVKTERVEFVELYNTTSSSIEISGWTLSDGVDFRFPDGTAIGPDGYLVIGEDPAGLSQKFNVTNALGPWSGRLANEGERLILRNGAGAVVDEVEYQLGFPWPTVGDAPGFSIELVNPGFDNDLGGNWRASVVGEATIQRETLIRDRATWRYFEGRTEASSPSTAWRERGFDDSSWSRGRTPIGYGERFISTGLEDMQFNYSSVFARFTFNVEDPAAISELVLEARFDDGFKVWINGKSAVSANLPDGEVPFDATANSAIENGEFVPFPLGAAANYLVAGENVIAAQIHNSSLGASSDFYFDLRLILESGPTARGPTPGAKNATYSDNIPPQIRQVAHDPEQPGSGDRVVITAKITDPDGVGDVSLLYQLVEPGNYIELSDAAYASSWTSISMNDSGTGADAFAGDGTYSVELPASMQVHRRLVRYRITATDGGARPVTVPYPDDPQPNFAYFVYDGVPAWSGAIQPSSPDPARRTAVTYGTNVMRRLPTYHLISKKSAVEDCTWFSQYGGDLYRWKGTLIYDGKVYDHIGYRARGGVWRYSMGKNMWKMDFNRGHDFEPRDEYGRRYKVPWTKLNLGACIQQGDYQHRGEQGMFESVGFRLFNLVGVEAPKTHFVQFRIIDEASESDSASQYNGDFWGLYLAVEQEDGRFLDEHGLPDGNFYKMEGGSGELNNQGLTGVTDKSDLNSFMGTYWNSGTSDEWWRENFSLDRYYSYQAIVQGIHHYDICYGKNYFYLLDPNTGIWSVHPWDLDLTWADNMYDHGCGGTDEFKNRVLPRPAFQLEFKNRVREIRDLLFNTDETWRLIDEYAAVIDDPNGGPAFVDADRAMWDYHPAMTLSNPSKAGQGRFYQVVPTKDFPGMVAKMKTYVIARGALLDDMAADPLIPDLPVIQTPSQSTVPIDQLNFRAAPYSGANPFHAMKWRVGEITDTNSPSFELASPGRYEIEPVWETAERTAFDPDITVPADAVKVGHTYRLRLRMKDNTGRWSHWSDPIVFTPAASENAASVATSLRITELMVNPPGGNEFEFVELQNASESASLDLGGVTFSQGIEFTFPTGTTLPPLGHLLVVRAASVDNFNTFRIFYDLDPAIPIVGPFSGALNNDGEEITLQTAGGGADIVSFEYGDGQGWPVAADGAGHSLVPANPLAESDGGASLNYPGNWRASAFRLGSPGAADPAPQPGLLLNEVVAHTDFAGETDSNDWIELYNPTSSPFEIGPGWFLSDDATDLKKWEIPSGTVVPALGWVAFDEATGFHSPPTVGFGLSKNGERVLLSHFPGTDKDRVVDSVRFEAQENEWSLGRYPDGGAWWLALPSRTRGAANSAPQQGVTISEVMFHPPDLSPGGEDNVADEFIEIYNPTSAPLSLFNTNGAWRLNGGVELVLPANTTLGPGKALLAVSFSPEDTAALNAFNNTYGLAGSDVVVVGPYVGRLSNSSDRIALEKPQYPDLTNTPPAWVVVDQVIYADRDPWPDEPDGDGAALHRMVMAGWGNDPAHWRAAAPSPGRVEGSTSDSDGDGLPDDWERAHGLNPDWANDAAMDADDDGLTNLHEYMAGTDPQDPASALRLTAALTEGGAAALRFNAVAGKAYVISYTDALGAADWEVLEEWPSGTESRAVEIIDSQPSATGQRYYQIQVR